MPVITTRSSMRAVRYHVGLRRSILLLSVAALHLVAAVSLVAQAPPADLFSQIFAQTMAKRQSLQSIRARFTETTTSTLLEKPLISHGTIVAAPPSRVLMTYIDPERRIIAIDSKSLTVMWPDRKQQEKIDISQTQKRIDQYFTQATLKDLRSMFDIKAEPDRALAGSDHVDMRPTRKQIKNGLDRLELWIDRESLLLTQMRLTFAGGDSKTIRLEDVVVNAPITDGTFQVRP